ncbi:carnosine N-methyltransferase, partial [Phenoliferia sp. Uapishka_3]
MAYQGYSHSRAASSSHSHERAVTAPEAEDVDISDSEAGEPSESAHQATVVATFDSYLRKALSANQRRRGDYFSLTEAHRALLAPDFNDFLKSVDSKLQINAELVSAMIESNVFPPEDPDAALSAPAPKEGDHEDWVGWHGKLCEQVRIFGKASKESVDAVLDDRFFLSSSEKWDAVGAKGAQTTDDIVTNSSLMPKVTCFFIDTARNIVEYLERIYAVLKHGGTWINCGPTLWHFENTAGARSIELTVEDVKELAKRIGFVIVEAKEIHTSYTSNPRSLLQHRYTAAFWVAKKL